MEQPPRASIRGIRSGPSFVQPAQARAYAAQLRALAAQWDAAANLCERLRAESPTELPAKVLDPVPPLPQANKGSVATRGACRSGASLASIPYAL